MEEEVAKCIPCLILSCLQHTQTHFNFNHELLKLIDSDMFESISHAVMHFYIAFDAEYKIIIEKIFEDPSFMTSKSRFLIKIGSRCLQMSDDPTFFNFLLMCGFIGRVVSFCYTNGKCYRVAETACKCAIAIFKRKFLELFNREGGLTGLLAYSEALHTTVLKWQDQYDDLIDILCPDLEGKLLVLRLLDSCIYVDSNQYFLSDFERKILYKAAKKSLRKIKPNLDFLIFRIPRKCFKMQKNQESRKVMHNAFGSNLKDIESDRTAECSLTDHNPFLSSVSYETDSCSLPIDYTMKRDSELLNFNIIEKQSDMPNCHTIEKLSKPSNYSTFEKPSEQSNFSITDGNKSESLDCYIIQKRFEPSSSSVSEKKPELSNFCNFQYNNLTFENSNTEKGSEPLNYCIAKKDCELPIKETIPGGSFSLVYHEMSREEMHSKSYETSIKEPKASTRSPQMLKRSFLMRSMNSELSDEGDGIRSPNCLQTRSSNTDVSVPKRPKISNSLQDNLALETDFSSSQKQLQSYILDLSKKEIHIPLRVSTFEGESPNSKRCLFEMEDDLPTKYSSNFGIPSDEDYRIQNYSTKSSNGSSLSIELQTEAIFPSTSIDPLKKSLGNTPRSLQEQYSSKVLQDKPFLKTQAEMPSESYKSDHRVGRHGISVSLSSSESSSSRTQCSSEGYYTSESENEEFQCYPSPFNSFQMSCSDSSLSESEYNDWKDDVTLESLMIHKCFHCGTKCFNYVMHVFQQFTSHFID